jgi:hypothetical protein
MHPDNIKAIRETERLLSIIKQHRDSIKSRVPDNDIRVSFFGLTGNVLHSLLLFFAATIQTIANPKWWKESYNKDSMTAQDLAAIKNLERLSKHSFFLFFFSRIETLLRKTINFVSTGFDTTGTTSFYNVYLKYLNEIGLDRYIPLFDICRLIRNTIHNNGVFISSSGNDRSISWNGKDFNFTHGSGIDFMSVDNIFFLYEELIDAINNIVNCPLFNSHSFIEDKSH